MRFNTSRKSWCIFPIDLSIFEFTVTDWVAFFYWLDQKVSDPIGAFTNRNVVLSKKDVHFKDTITLLISRVKAIDGIQIIFAIKPRHCMGNAVISIPRFQCCFFFLCLFTSSVNIFSRWTSDCFASCF